MATSINYSALLGLAEPVTGQEVSVWGDDVNKGITEYIDVSVAGTNNLTANTDVTLTISNGNYAATNITSTTAQYAILNCTGARTAIRNINAPASSKIYQIINNTSGGFAVVIRGTNSGPTYTTGVSVANGERCIVAWDTVGGGTPDFVKIASSSFSGLTGTLPAVNGGTGKAGTITGLPYANGTSPYTQASAAQIVAAIGSTPVAIATSVNNIAGGSANQLVYQNSTGVTTFAPAPTTGYVLGWTGTAFTWVAAPAATTAANLAGGAAFQVPYQTAPSTTAFSSNFQFNGTYLTVGNGTALTATNPTFAAIGNQNLYIQSYIYNSNSGSSASADIVAYADNSTEASGWIDMSFASSTYADAAYTVIGPNEGSITMSAPSGASKTGNLVYATDSTGTANAHQWYVGGFTQAKSAYKMQLTSTELTLATPLKVSGRTGPTGYLLASTGGATPPTWTDPTAFGTANGKLYFFGQF